MDRSAYYPMQPYNYEVLLHEFNLGNSVAENDPLLEEAKIDTQEFRDIWEDRIDLVRGVKGSGKTAMFRVFDFARPYLLKTNKVLIIQGVEARGDPVFKYYQKEFQKFKELDFQDFWRIYFVNLVITFFLNKRPGFRGLKEQSALIKQFYIECKKVGIPTIRKRKSFRDIINGIIAYILSFDSAEAGVTVETDSSNPLTTKYIPSIKFKRRITKENEERSPIIVNDLRDLMVKILENMNLNIWIMLDRLDEVFLRRSTTEINALKALLRSAYSFSNTRLRVKIFLRDDIFEAIISEKEGFSGLTHGTSRSCAPISWSKDQLVYLIVKRIFTNIHLSRYFAVNVKSLEKNKDLREESFYKLFPDRVISGRNQPRTIDWIYKNCQDANGVITPRDVIDLLDFAKQKQHKLFVSDRKPQESFISSKALLEAFDELSERKRDSYLRAEFPHFWDDISKFQDGRAEHNASSLEKLLGKDWLSRIENLKHIGFIEHISKSKTYKVPLIWRHGLKIKQGKAFRSFF